MPITKNNFVQFCFLLFLFVFALSTSPVHAFGASDADEFAKQANTEGVGATETDINVMAARIAKAAFSIGGIIFFLLMFYGGYTWLMARGEEEEVQKAQNIIIGAIIGLFIMVGSYAITNFVLDKMITQTPVSGGADSGATGEEKGDLGCCLEEIEAAGNAWSWGNDKYWNSVVTDAVNCEKIGKTCSSKDQLCGPQNWNFYPVSSEHPENEDKDACWDKAEKLNEGEKVEG